MERIKRKKRKSIEIERNIIERFLMNLKESVKNNRKVAVNLSISIICLFILFVVALVYFDKTANDAQTRFDSIMFNYWSNQKDKKIVRKTLEDLNELRDSTYFGFVHNMSNYIIGNIYFENKEYKKAKKFLLLYVNDNSQSVFTGLALLKAAISAEESNDFDASLKIYNGLLDKYSNSLIADQIYYNMGRLYYKKNDKKSAEKYFNLLMSSYPQSNLVKNAKTRLMLMGIKIK